VLLVVSLLRGEFLPHRAKSAMQVALAVAMVTFACLAFGQTATGQFAGTASLYQYFGATVLILLLVSFLPPNRPDSWLRFTRSG
jgi:putative Mn2+ efflux pump MntP